MTFVLLTSLCVMGASVNEEGHPTPHADQVKRARFSWAGLKQNREALVRGVYRATGRRRIEGKNGDRASGPIEIFSAFDFSTALRRFDRSEPQLVPKTLASGDEPAQKQAFAPERLSARWAASSGKEIEWFDIPNSDDVAIVKAGSSSIKAIVAPFDVRTVGLIYWNKDNGNLDFEKAFQTWQGFELIKINDIGANVVEIVTAPGSNHAVENSIWIDEAKGFSPIRSEVRVNVNGAWQNPCYVSELTWTEVSGVWVPKTYHNELHVPGGARVEEYDLAFEWVSINQPVEPKLFTIEGLKLKEGTEVIETRFGEPFTAEIIGKSFAPVPKAASRKPRTNTQSTGRAWKFFLLFNVTIIAIVAGILLYMKRTGRRMRSAQDD